MSFHLCTSEDLLEQTILLLLYIPHRLGCVLYIVRPHTEIKMSRCGQKAHYIDHGAKATYFITKAYQSQEESRMSSDLELIIEFFTLSYGMFEYML